MSILKIERIKKIVVIVGGVKMWRELSYAFLRAFPIFLFSDKSGK